VYFQVPRTGFLKRFLFLVVLIAMALWAMRVTYMERARLTPLEIALKDTLAPIQGEFSRMGRQVSESVFLIFSIGEISAQNESLKRKVAQLEGELVRLQELEYENERLRRLLDFKSNMHGGYELVTAAVIARDPGNWFGTITLNKGSRDNIKKNMPVLTPCGLVGRVMAVSNNAAEVLLITDPRSGVGALIQENRVPGVVEGVANSSGYIRMIHIREDAPVEKGQTVVTSGMGGSFPKGIPVGTVVDVRKVASGLLKEALLRPFVDFNRLEEVFILTGVDEQLAEADEVGEAGRSGESDRVDVVGEAGNIGQD